MQDEFFLFLYPEISVQADVQVMMPCMDKHRLEILVIIQIPLLGANQHREGSVQQDYNRERGSCFGLCKNVPLLLGVCLNLCFFFGLVFQLLPSALEQINDDLPRIAYGCRYRFANRSPLGLKGIGSAADGRYRRPIGADKGSRTLGYNNAFHVLIGRHLLFGDDTCHLAGRDVPQDTLVCHDEVRFLILAALLVLCRLMLRWRCLRHISGNFRSALYTKLGSWF